MLSAKNLYIDKISNYILMIMNKLIKHTTYITVSKDLNIKDLANIL